MRVRHVTRSGRHVRIEFGSIAEADRFVSAATGGEVLSRAEVEALEARLDGNADHVDLEALDRVRQRIRDAR